MFMRYVNFKSMFSFSYTHKISKMYTYVNNFIYFITKQKLLIGSHDNLKVWCHFYRGI